MKKLYKEFCEFTDRLKVRFSFICSDSCMKCPVLVYYVSHGSLVHGTIGEPKRNGSQEKGVNLVHIFPFTDFVNKFNKIKQCCIFRKYMQQALYKLDFYLDIKK